jgi:hypothetical protein
MTIAVPTAAPIEVTATPQKVQGKIWSKKHMLELD